MMPAMHTVIRDDNNAPAWRTIWTVTLVLLAVRVFYLVFLCGYELVADEAHYWDWSRRLELSYYSKGPGVAWLIAASTGLFGDHEWSVRLPAAIISAVGMLSLAALTAECSRGVGGLGKSAFYAAVCFALLPGYQAVAILMTIDGPWITAWILAAWAAHRAMRVHDDGRRHTLAWICLGAALGAGVLLKYTMLLLVPGLLIFAFRWRRRLVWNRGDSVGLPLGVIVFGAAVSPVLIWNHRHGWPTLWHLLGRIQLPGGDMPVQWQWSVRWPLEFAAAQLGLLTPFVAVLIVIAIRYIRREEQRDAPPAPSSRWASISLMIWCAVPIIVFYVVLSLFKKAQGNWAIAGYATLLVPVGQYLAVEMPRYRRMLKEWKSLPKPRPKRGFLVRRPETVAQGLWHWTIATSVVAGVVIALGPTFLEAPVVRDMHWAQRLALRVSGRKAEALRAHYATTMLATETGMTPIICSDHYGRTSLLAFYLPTRPPVYCASPYFGGRRTAYDFFDDTDLGNPALRGKVFALVCGTGGDGMKAMWSNGLKFDEVFELDDGPPTIFVGMNYQGPRAERNDAR